MEKTVKILLLVNDGNSGINLIYNKVCSLKGVNVKIISVKNRDLNFFGKTFSLIQKLIIFTYSKNFSFMDLFRSLLPSKRLKVDNVNSIQVSTFIDNYNPDLLVISGTKKVNIEILKKVKIKINLHHGIVPFYRGVSSPSWVVYEKDFGNFGISIHEATEIIDG